MDSKVIHKRALSIGDQQWFVEPGFQLLDAQYQANQLVVWYLHDYRAEKTKRITIDVIGTGINIYDNPGVYFRTVQCGSFVAHIFVKE